MDWTLMSGRDKEHLDFIDMIWRTPPGRIITDNKIGEKDDSVDVKSATFNKEIIIIYPETKRKVGNWIALETLVVYDPMKIFIY